MNRPFTRRLLAYAGSALLGLAGAFVLASPAQAHHTVVTAKAKCTPNEWVITWTVENWDTEMSASLQVTSNPDTPITNIADGATLPGKTKNLKGGKLTGDQSVPLTTDFADLTVTGTWTNGKSATNSGHIDLDVTNCGHYKAAVTGSARCDADTGTWQVTWLVVNKHYTHSANTKIVVNPLDAKFTGTSTGGTWTPLADKTQIVGLADAQVIPGGATVTATQSVPGTASAARLKVKLNWPDGPTASPSPAATPVPDASPTTAGAIDTDSGEVAFEGACVKNAPKPSVTFAVDCTGVVTVTLLNAAEATKAATFVVTGTDSWTSGEIVVQVGEKSVPVTVPAKNAKKISVTEGGVLLPGGEYTPEVQECDEPSPPPSGSPQPHLPTTGANVTLAVFSGLALIAVGAVVFLLARRRRLNLTDV
ncbi:LPXTG cell wall anchor domain-containing protein [Catellatospora tritici]|uniref:LPXTG cell wall anchor domain-containing protein n=1 Tax=Catellatospora tritici TaxID=2851566 RepID=UPI001C2DC8C5|nr:LPXTG cell wall anchor domain-containing protein [Catellatospora tritici]MBV1848673.1 LPXTG cell wall anchor domain-containing protein [Catellatospora tritici]